MDCIYLMTETAVHLRKYEYQFNESFVGNFEIWPGDELNIGGELTFTDGAPLTLSTRI